MEEIKQKAREEMWEEIVKISYATDLKGRHYVDLQDLRPVFDSLLSQALKKRDEEWVKVIEEKAREEGTDPYCCVILCNEIISTLTTK